MIVAAPFLITLLMGWLYWIYPFAKIDPFRFTAISAENVGVASGYILLAGVVAIIAYKNTKHMRRTIDFQPKTFALGNRGSVKNAVPTQMFLLVLIFIVASFLSAYFVYATWPRILSGAPIGMANREVLSKLSPFLLLLLSICWVSAAHFGGKGVRLLSVVIPIFVSLGIALAENSRESVLPIAIPLLYFLTRKNFVLAIILFVALLASITLSMVGRDIDLQIVPSLSFEEIGQFVVEAINYPTGFSLLHLAENVEKDFPSSFTLDMLSISILPFPSDWIGIESLEGRNIDSFRPYGAAADLISFSIVIYMIYWGVYGWTFAMASRLRGISFLIVSSLLWVCFIVSFQYHLRGSIRFLELVWVILLLYSIIGKIRFRRKVFVQSEIGVSKP